MCKDKLPLLLRDTNHVLNSGVCNLKAQSHMTSLGLIPPGRDSFFVCFSCLGRLQLVVEISSQSPISLGYCANSSFISQLLGELTGDDVLIR